ncbi:MAG: hypothetical protein Q8N99_03010 [Nanoarchaeota archaeon]|nr:hypothetical protein [Nanoarchaeota archaeon]
MGYWLRRIEFGNNVIDTLRNEINQEYCTLVLDYQFLGYRGVHRINEKERKTHWISIDFKVLIDRSLVRNGEPHKLDEIAWFKEGEWPKPYHSQFDEFLRLHYDLLIESKKQSTTP